MLNGYLHKLSRDSKDICNIEMSEITKQLTSLDGDQEAHKDKDMFKNGQFSS